MPFGSLSSAQQILVLLSLRGAGAYEAQMAGASAQTSRLGKAILTTSANMQIASKRTFLHNQMLYTSRRLLFYTTLGFIGLGAEVARLGFSYDNTVQSAKVALSGMFPSQKAMDSIINRLYKISTLSPFLFTDVLTSFRTMAPQLRDVGVSAGLTVTTIQALTDALSVSNKATPGNLTRIGTQLQHLANIGKPTGQILQSLGREGLPVWPALRKELHLTGVTLANFAKSNITAKQVIMALDKYIETSPVYKGAALKLANQTLQGSWQQFRDILAQAAGRGEIGAFGGLHRILFDINKQLQPLLINNKPITLYNIAHAIDHAISPRTHLFLNMFVTINTALHTTIILFGAFFIAVTTLLRPFNYLASLFGINNTAAKLLGITIGVLTTTLIAARTATIAKALADDAAKFAVAGLAAASFICSGVMKLLTFLTEVWTAATVVQTRVWKVQIGEMALSTKVGLGLRGMFISLTAWMDTLTVSTIAWYSALTLGVAALIYLYARYRGFRNFVNSTAEKVAFGATTADLRAQRAASSTTQTSHRKWWQGLEVWKHGIPMLATGGHVMRSGMAVVGEAGPELVRMSKGAVVQPLRKNALQGIGQLAIYVYPQDIYLDGKKIGTSVATAVADAGARL